MTFEVGGLGCWNGCVQSEKPGKGLRVQEEWLRESTALRRIRRKHEDETRRSCGVSGTEGAQEHNLVTVNKNQKQVSGQFTGMVITCSMSSGGYMVYRLVMNDWPANKLKGLLSDCPDVSHSVSESGWHWDRDRRIGQDPTWFASYPAGSMRRSRAACITQIGRASCRERV